MDSSDEKIGTISMTSPVRLTLGTCLGLLPDQARCSMSAHPVNPTADPTNPDGRDAKGEWRPLYTLRYSPLLTWPLRIRICIF